MAGYGAKPELPTTFVARGWELPEMQGLRPRPRCTPLSCEQAKLQSSSDRVTRKQRTTQAYMLYVEE